MNLPTLGLADLNECSMGGSGDQPRESVQNDYISPMGSQLSSSTDRFVTDHRPSLHPNMFDEAVSVSSANENFLYNRSSGVLLRKQANEYTEDNKEANETKSTREKDFPILKDVFTGGCLSPEDNTKADGTKFTEEKEFPTLKDVFTSRCPSSVLHGSFTSSLRGTFDLT